MSAQLKEQSTQGLYNVARLQGIDINLLDQNADLPVDFACCVIFPRPLATAFGSIYFNIPFKFTGRPLIQRSLIGCHPARLDGDYGSRRSLFFLTFRRASRLVRRGLIGRQVRPLYVIQSAEGVLCVEGVRLRSVNDNVFILLLHVHAAMCVR